MNYKSKIKKITCFLLSGIFLNGSLWLKNNLGIKALETSVSKNAILLKSDLNFLGTGENEHTEKIVLGNLSEDVQYDDGAMINTTDGKKGINDIQLKKGTPVQWYIVGTDNKGTLDIPNNAVLYSAKPLLSEDGFFNDFQKTRDNDLISFSDISDRNIDYSPKSNPSNVYVNHYGGSRIRRILNDAIVKIFKTGQRHLLQNSVITTYNILPGADANDPKDTYKVSDLAYVPSATNDESQKTDPSSLGSVIYVGENTALPISQKYLGPKVWLRTANNWSENFTSIPEISSTQSYYESGTPAISGAIKIDLSNVNFLAKTQGIETNSIPNFTETDTANNMYLRMEGGKGSISKDGNKVYYKSVPENSKLIAMASVADKIYEFSESVSGEGSINLGEKGLPPGAVYDAWIEQAGTGLDEGLILSTALATEQITSNPFDQMSNGVRVTADPGVFPNNSVLNVGLSSNDTQGYDIIKKYVQNHAKVSNYTTYDVKVYAPINTQKNFSNDSSGEQLVDKFSEAMVYLPISPEMNENYIKNYFLSSTGFISNGTIEKYQGKKYYVFPVNNNFDKYISINSLDGTEFPKTGDSLSYNNETIEILLFTLMTSFMAYLIIKNKRVLT